MYWFTNVDPSPGRFDAAVNLARTAFAHQHERDQHAAFQMHAALGRILVISGRREEALAALKEFIGKPHTPIPDNIRHDPIWTRLKDDPRFEEILQAGEAAIRSRN